MHVALLQLLLVLLVVNIYIIIPTYAPGNKEEITEWVGLGFNGVLFAVVLYETSFKYMNVYGGITALIIAIGIALSGIYWWIPKYIPKNKQTEVTKDMFTGLGISILLTNILTNAVPVTMGGRRR